MPVLILTDLVGDLEGLNPHSLIRDGLKWDQGAAIPSGPLGSISACLETARQVQFFPHTLVPTFFSLLKIIIFALSG